MVNPTSPAQSRRRFLRLLATSPLLPLINLPESILQALQQDPASRLLHDHDPDGTPASVLESELAYLNNLSSAQDALSIFDLEFVARKKLHVGHLAYLSGTEDNATLRANRDGFTRYQLRGRRLAMSGRSMHPSRCSRRRGIRRSSCARPAIRRPSTPMASSPPPGLPRPRDISRHSPRQPPARSKR